MTSVPEIAIERWDHTHPRWDALRATCEAMGQGGLEEKMCDFHLGLYTCVAHTPEEIAGFARFWTQQIGIDEDKPPFSFRGQLAIEAKVVALGVSTLWQRRGLGRQLQFEIVRWARELDCYQVRSRSDYACHGNHALKSSLGFTISPGRNEAPADTAFFALPLHLPPDLAALCTDT